MLANRKRPYRPEELANPAQRLRANLRDVFSDNQLSGQRTQEIIDDVHNCNIRGFRDLHSGRSAKGKNAYSSNHTRKLTRRLLKGCQWPPLYWAKVRNTNLKTKKEEYQWCAFMLPHEYIDTLSRYGNSTVLHDRSGMDPLTLQHLLSCEADAGSQLLGVGLWGDGAPCNWDRSDSVETFSLNLLGQGGEFKGLRLPLTAISRKQISTHTWDDILEVISWSLNHLATGTRPQERHDSTQFLKSDAWRKKMANESTQLRGRGALVEVRGDWKFFGEVFKFPKWNTKRGCCWTCRCTPAEVRRA